MAMANNHHRKLGVKKENLLCISLRSVVPYMCAVFASLLIASTAQAGAVASLGSIGTADTQVTPNTFGEYRTAAEDMRVKVLGGYIRITRDWVDGAWSLNKRWSPINTSADAQYKDEPYQHCWSSYTDNDGVYHAGGCEMLTQQVFVGITRNGVPYNTTLRTEETKDGTLLTTYQQDNDKSNVLEVETKSVEGSATPEVVGLKWRNTEGDWIRYDPSNGGRVVSAYGDRNNVQVSLQYDSTGRLNGLLDHNGKQVVWYDYDADGRVGAVRDYSGRKVEYHYTSGKLTDVVDVRGNTWVYGYNGKGLLSKKVDPNGHATTLEYATNGALTVFRDPSGAEKHYKYEFDKTKREFYKQEKSAAGVVTETWYDKDGAFLRKAIAGTVDKRIERDGNTETWYNEAGNATVMQYDSWHRLIKQTHPDGTSTSTTYYADTAWPTKHTDENGVVTKYEYDAYGNLTKLTEAVGLAEQRITTFTYDDYGYRLSQTVEADSVSEAVTEKYSYDAYGNRTSHTDGEGSTTSYTFDVMGNTTSATDPLKHTWTYTYDANGNPLGMTDPVERVTTREYDKVGNLIKETKPGSRITQYGYDVNDKLVAVTDANNGVTKRVYNAGGRPVSVTDAIGVSLQFSYDNAGRPTQLTDNSSSAITLSYTSGQVNGAGKIASIQYPTYSTTFRYDARGCTVVQNQVADGKTLTTTYQYDSVGNKTAVTDPKGHTTHYRYDALGRQVEVIDPLKNATTFSYDNRDNQLTVTDANGGTTRYSYLKNNLKVSETRALGGVIQYGYDEAGNLTSEIDPAGRMGIYHYDAVGRLLGEQHFANSGDESPELVVSFSYDEANNLTGYDDGYTSASYSYDVLNQLTDTTVNFGNFSKHFAYQYNAAGDKRRFIDAASKAIDYSYDDGGRLSAISIPDFGTLTVNSYQWASLPTKLTLPGGSSREVGYDGLMQVNTIRSKDPAGDTLLDNTYQYDAAGNITAKGTEHGTYRYGYDELNRLTSVDNPILNDEAYSYDVLGNRLSDSNQPGEWGYNLDNQLTNIGDTTTYSYDDSGSLSTRVKSGVTRSYHYNAKNRLAEVKEGESILGQYRYDPFGRRISKTVNGQTTWFLYSEEGLIGEYGGSGNTIRQYGWWPDGAWGTDPVYLQTNGQTYFYHNDQLGTPQKLTSISGAVVWSAQYQSFGQAHVGAMTVDNPLRFPGQYYDAETGTHYNYFRDYDPNIGRYHQTDPVGFYGGLNVYGYSYGNPVLFFDPTGEFGLVGALIGAALEFGIQMATNGWNIHCVDWVDVIMMGAVGAVAPSSLASAGKVYKAIKGTKILKAQRAASRTANRVAKLNRRINRHTSTIKKELATQSAIAAGKYAAKKAINDPDADDGCDNECK